MRIAIHTKTKEEFKKVLEIFENKGWKWGDRSKPLKYIDLWENKKEQTCIEYKNGFLYDSKSLCEKINYKIISFEEFLEMEGIIYKPTPEEIIQEMLLNIKEQLE